MRPHVLQPESSPLVLIVDDVPESLAALHDMLDETGYTALVASDGPTALVRARQARPDVILLDALMPGMDGFEVARRLVCSGQISTVESDTPLRGPDRCVQFGNGWGVRARL